MADQSFDLVVIGSGPGGYVAAIRATQLGLKTAIVEKMPTLGGTCLNIGCIPSKALLQSSELYETARHKMKKHGVLVKDVELDLKAMLQRKDAVVKQLTTGIASLMKKNQISVFAGMGRLNGRGRVDVSSAGGETMTLTAKHVIVATGSAPIELPFAPFDGDFVVSSTEALAFEAVPQHLVVVGAGAIGLEMGSVWLRLGAEVTVVELLPRIAPFADKEASDQLQKSLERQGMRFILGGKLTEIDKAQRRVAVDAGGEKIKLGCDKVLIAVGRKAYTEGLGLETVGLAVDKRGKIAVDGHFRTAVEGIYAIGDVIDGPMLAHKAEEDGIACVEGILGQHCHVNWDTVPSVVYTWPELASVGKTEEELKAKGVAYKVGSFPFFVNARAKAMDERDGLVKVLAGAEDDRLLGVHIVGPNASELIAEAVTVAEFGGSAEDIGRTVHAHPTLSEVVKEAALAAMGRPLHR